MSGTKDAVLQVSTTDQRKFQRFSVSFPVSFGDGIIVQTGTVVDLSREGCRIRCADAPPEVKYLQVQLQMDDPSHALTVDLAVIRWSRNGELGVEFIRMEPDQQARLRHLIRLREVACSRQDPAEEAGTCPIAVGAEGHTEGQP